MTREKFIIKWLAVHHEYNEYYRDEMRNDLDKVAEKQCDAIQNIFTKPYEVLKPLEDLWRKENSPDRFVLPDRTEFFKWIVLKIIPIETEYCNCISRVGVSGTEHGKWTCRSCKKEVKH